VALAAANFKPSARASLFAVGLAWTLPFLQPVHRNPIPSFYGEWLAFALGLAAALLLLQRQLWTGERIPGVALAPLALIVLLVLQIVLGRVVLPDLALTAALYLIWATLLIVLGAALVRELGLATVVAVLAWFLLAGGMLNAVAGFLQHYWPAGELGPLIAPKYTVAVYGNIGQANHFANYEMLALASVAYLYARGKLHASWAAACAIPLLLVLSLSGSRSPGIYVAVIGALAFWFARARSAECGRALRFFLCLLPGLLVSNWFVTLPFMIPEKGWLVTSGERWFTVASGIEARVQLAREAWSMFAEAPLLGAGWGQFAWHHFQYVAVTGARAAHGVFNHAHNLVSQLMAESGALGAAATVGAVLAWLRRSWGGAPAIENWWLLSLLAVLAIHSLLEMPLWYSNFLGIAAVLLGAGAGQFLVLKAGPAARFAVAAIIAVGGLNLVWVLQSYRDFERLTAVVPRDLAAAPDAQSIRGKLLEAHRDPFLTHYVELAASPGIVISEDGLRDKIELSSRAMRFMPGDLEVYRHALLLALADEREAALTHLEWASRVYPHRLPAVVDTLAQVARRHPDKLEPLLALARARSEALRVPGATP
jgi:O-antigen ligase